MDQNWKSDLERWLTPFLSAFRHKARARICPVYVAGLIGAGDRKSVQPMAARDGEVGYDQLHHFIASGLWDAAPLEKALLAEADRMVGGDERVADRRRYGLAEEKGAHSVGVAPQYASAPREDRQLPVTGVAHLGVTRGSGDGGPAALPTRELDG